MSIAKGVAGGVCVSEVGDRTSCSHVDEAADDEVSEFEDFEEESMLSALLRLPPMPDSGVATLRCLPFPFSISSMLFTSLIDSLPSSLSGSETLMLASEESDDIHVEVTISLSISLDEAPPAVSQEFEFDELE